MRELAKAADEALQRERNNKTTKKRKDDEPELQGNLLKNRTTYAKSLSHRKNARIERSTC